MAAQGHDCLVQKSYWIEHYADLTVEAMMSDSKAVGLDKEERLEKSYWIEHFADINVEAMMLDSKAADLDKEEGPEVCTPPAYDL
ncbi:hypothetical protein CRG98_035432 [Punica granatum]|uniref:Uncharacterized protein n=1 Tax=Punica granatum TaxID=22663 RepID=A0A2I0IJM2_PUNGR|nr:hypothetical protein CRG98_035432 [Punica granatum]